MYRNFEGIKSKLASVFVMKDLDVVKSYLGTDNDCHRDTGEVKLSQSQFVTEVYKLFAMYNCKPASRPMEAKRVL